MNSVNALSLCLMGQDTNIDIQVNLIGRDEIISFIEFNERKEKDIVESIAKDTERLARVRKLLFELRSKLNTPRPQKTFRPTIEPLQPSIGIRFDYPYGGTWADKIAYILKHGNPDGMTTKEILDEYFKYDPVADREISMKSATGILSAKSKHGGVFTVDKSSGRFIYKLNREYDDNKKGSEATV